MQSTPLQAYLLSDVWACLIRCLLIPDSKGFRMDVKVYVRTSYCSGILCRVHLWHGVYQHAIIILALAGVWMLIRL